MANETMIRKTWALMAANRQRWDQDMWTAHNECGTTFCTGGFAVLAAGGTVRSGYFYDQDGEQISELIQDWAGDVLGLDERQRDMIFFNFTRNLGEQKARIEEATGITLDDDPEPIKLMDLFTDGPDETKADL